jgi:hypothetical protein
MDPLKKETIEKDNAIRRFLKYSNVSGMKCTTLPRELSDLGTFLNNSAREFDKLFKNDAFETTLADNQMRRKLKNYLDEMESMLKALASRLAILADDVRDDKIVLAIVESDPPTPVTDVDYLEAY